MISRLLLKVGVMFDARRNKRSDRDFEDDRRGRTRRFVPDASWIDLGKPVCWLALEPVRHGPVLTADRHNGSVIGQCLCMILIH